MKNHKGLRAWADSIAGKYDFAAVVLDPSARLDSDCFDSPHPAAKIADRIHARHQIENLIQTIANQILADC